MRLIDADALEQAIDKERQILIEQGRPGAEHIIVHYARRLVEEAPTIDIESQYKAERETLRMRCVPGAEQAFDKRMYGCLKIVPVNYKTEQK